MERVLLDAVELGRVVARNVQVEMVRGGPALVVGVVLERQLHQDVPGAGVAVAGLVPAGAAADAEVGREGLAELAHEAEVARVGGGAVLGLGEAGVVVDEAAAVRVGEEEEAHRLDRRV